MEYGTFHRNINLTLRQYIYLTIQPSSQSGSLLLSLRMYRNDGSGGTQLKGEQMQSHSYSFSCNSSLTVVSLRGWRSLL
jgi:hypothetical protein